MNDESLNPDAEIEALKRRIAELEAARNIAAPSIHTQGGTAIQGGVQTQGGYFIGRDYIQYVTQVTQSGEDPEEAKSVVAHYLDALTKDLAGLKLGEIDESVDQSKQKPLQLADIYVPLNTTLRIPTDTPLVQWLSLERGHRDYIASERKTRPVTALEALAAHRELTVLGKAGGGKSTFGASVLLTLAQAWQGHGEELTKLGAAWAHGPLFPIRVILRRFAENLPPGDAPARAGDLWAFIAGELAAGGYGLSADTMKFVQRIARKHGAMFLLDGLDECGNEAGRKRILGAVQEFMTRGAGPASRFLLTARPYAWPDGPDPAGGVYMLDDLDDQQIEQFIQSWYAALVKRNWRSPGDAAEKCDDLLAARGRPDLLPLARNPLLLTLMATLHSNLGRLPDDRADLYNKSVDLLMLRWNQKVGADQALLGALAMPGLTLTNLREVLEGLAFRIHEESTGQDGAADIAEHVLVNAFRPLLGNSKDKADVVVDYIEKRAGLLLWQSERAGEQQFAFPHRTFQEFLAACHLANSKDFPGECVRLARAAPAHWQVALPLAARLAKAERGASAADELIGGSSISEFGASPQAADWTCALLAGQQLREIGAGMLNTSARTRAIKARVAGWLAASLPVHPDQGGLPAIQRAQAGDVLAALGDPRFDPEYLFLPAAATLGFVRIPADPDYCIGTRKADKQRVKNIVGWTPEEEFNDRPTPTPEFHIARYPVTVAQFRAFVTATGYEIGDADALRDPDSRPVRFVSWNEALDYCVWLNDRLAHSSELEGSPTASLVREGGWRVTLPSELEWEKAARGGLRDAVFPWGNDPDPERANYEDTGIGDTATVGCFPAVFGLHDMAGNVFEWTRSLWQPYPYDDIEQRENLDEDGNRVVRGGAWRGHRDSARCASRYGVPPGSRDGALGFRVVLSPVRRR